jgi:hypothetical protein
MGKLPYLGWEEIKESIENGSLDSIKVFSC